MKLLETRLQKRRGMREQNRQGTGAPQKDLARSVRSSVGFTLTEALATVIIVGLVTSILAGGIALAVRQYTKSMAASESQMLYTSLERILDNELRYTTRIFTSGSEGETGNKVYQVTGFESKHYFGKGDIRTHYLCTIAEDGTVYDKGRAGELAMCNDPSDPGTVTNSLLGTGAYNYGLAASVESFTYSESSHDFSITLYISNGNQQAPLASGTFTVRALNKPIIS